MSVLLVTSVVLPGLAVLVGLSLGPERRDRVAGAAVTLNLVALAFALAVFAAVLDGSTVSAVVENGSGEAVAGLVADRVTAMLLLLVLGVSAVVQAFAGRYLSGDVRAARFFNGANLLTFSTALMVTSVTLIGLAVAWTVAGISVVLLLSMYCGFEAAREGVRRAIRVFVIGDIALWSAVILATIEWGTLDLRTLGQSGPDLAGAPVLVPVAVLLVVAAMARSAQLPLQNWLPATLAVPTPVSALLHAGVVNAGGILLVRMSPVFGASSEATHLAFFAGAATTVYGTALMLSKADVKGALAHSTMGQMGFMIMTCGLGAYAAAVFHLFAHGMYKATLFLGSGAAVHSHVRHAKAPPVRQSTGMAARAFRVILAAALPALALVVFAELLYPDRSSGANALLLFAWATGAWVIHGWTGRHASPAGALAGAALVTAAAGAYVLLLSSVSEFLAPSLAGAGDRSSRPGGWSPSSPCCCWPASLRSPAPGAGSPRSARPHTSWRSVPAR